MDNSLRNLGIAGLIASELYIGPVNAQYQERLNDAKAQFEQKVDEAIENGKEKIEKWSKKIYSLVKYNKNLIKEADIKGDNIYYRNSSKGIYDIPTEPINFKFSKDGKNAKFGICKYTKNKYGEVDSRKYIVFEVRYNEKDNSWTYTRDWEWKEEKRSTDRE